MDIEGVRDALRRATEKAGTASAWGDAHDISSAYISDILHGRRDPGDKLLTALGLVKSVDYAPPLKPPVSQFLTDLDCTQEDARRQARWELDRAVDGWRDGSPSGLGGWALKWGPSLIAAADNADQADEIEQANNEATEAERQRDAAFTDMAEASVALGGIADMDETPDDIADIIRNIADTLDKAST